MSAIFSIIIALMQAFRLWNAFLDFLVSQHDQEIQKRQQARNKAVDDASNAQTQGDAWKAEEGVVNNEPKP